MQQFKFAIFRFATQARLSLLTAFFSNKCNNKKKDATVKKNMLAIYKDPIS